MKRAKGKVLLFILVFISSELILPCNAAKASGKEPKYLGFLSINTHYFHPSDLFFLQAYETGKVSSFYGRLFLRKSGFGMGFSYRYNARSSKHENLESIITQEFLVSVLYRIAQFRKPFRINPFMGCGGGLVYFQENTFPTVILRFEDYFSDTDKLLWGGSWELGIPMQFTNHLGAILQIDTEFAWLPSKETNFDENFQVGGISYGVGICYYF